MDKLKANVTRWIELDDKLHDLNESIDILKTERDDITDDILDFVEHTPISEKIIKIPGGSISFKTTKRPGSMSVKTITEAMETHHIDCMKEVFQTIKQIRNRESKSDLTMARTFD